MVYTAGKCSKMRLWLIGTQMGARQSKGSIENLQGTRGDKSARRAPLLLEVRRGGGGTKVYAEHTNLRAV